MKLFAGGRRVPFNLSLIVEYSYDCNKGSEIFSDVLISRSILSGGLCNMDQFLLLHLIVN